jgi:hypothetical protein
MEMGFFAHWIATAAAVSAEAMLQKKRLVVERLLQ